MPDRRLFEEQCILRHEGKIFFLPETLAGASRQKDGGYAMHGYLLGEKKQVTELAAVWSGWQTVGLLSRGLTCGLGAFLVCFYAVVVGFGNSVGIGFPAGVAALVTLHAGCRILSRDRPQKAALRHAQICHLRLAPDEFQRICELSSQEMGAPPARIGVLAARVVGLLFLAWSAQGIWSIVVPQDTQTRVASVIVAVPKLAVFLGCLMWPSRRRRGHLATRLRGPSRAHIFLRRAVTCALAGLVFYLASMLFLLFKIPT